jgi:eukaryotic-like serine/threonine-protein kinase
VTQTPPPPPTGVDPLVGRVLDGRYRIESFLARGGMATIYRGADLRLDRTVAIKVMHPTFATDPGFVDRFEREARAAARLNSPYAVAVHDQGNDAGVTYLVMEYVPGHTVRDVLRTHGALPPAQALAIIDPVLQALAAAHRAGYIHRDVKPENVLISEDGRVKVTDFGLARAIEGVDSGKTHGLLLGTVAYLSPEQVEHDHTDARSDVYSAGILLFELVTGQVPFTASAPMQVAYRHVHEDVPAPSSIRPGIPSGIDDLVLRATRRDPDQRFGDADAFLAAARVQKDALPAAQPWAPSPTDTLVVNRDADAPVAAATAAAASVASAADQQIDAPDWVNHRPEPAAPAAGVPAVPTPAQPPAASAASPRPDGEAQVTEVSHQTSPDAPGRPRRGRKALWLGGLALISVVALLVLAFGPLQRVTVPDLRGKTPTEAAAILAPSNLVLDADGSDFSEDYAKGVIMSTDPGPTSSARSGSTVRAVVSKGPERYDVPKLKKLSVKEAEVALGAANLELGTQTEAYHDSVKKGDIISSDPPAGESVKPGTKVAVVVSKGPEPVTMPTLEGTNGDDAEATLKDLGLTVDRSDKTSESVAKGLVISTDPDAGATTYRGDTVTLVVSKGPPLVAVPNVVGKSEDEARSALEAAGFKVSVNKPLGFVVFGVNSQNPRGGTKAPKGSTVTITVV